MTATEPNAGPDGDADLDGLALREAEQAALHELQSRLGDDQLSDAFLEDVDAFERERRDELADGVDHITERR